MARDYARPRNTGNRGNGRGAAASRRAPEPASGPGVPGWVYLMVGLAIGLAVAVFMYISRPSNKVAIGTAPDAATAAAAKDDTKKPIPLPPKQPSRFAFYEMLPSYEVVIPRDTVKAAPKPGQPATAAPTAPPDVKAAIAAPGQYLIQVGAYRSREEADKGRANLALLGVESKIEQVTIASNGDQNEVWYRVRIGPVATLEAAQETIERLDDNGIKGMLVKVKS
jgi:cell division protein FtsN